MKREIKAPKQTTVNYPKPSKAYERQFAQAVAEMVKLMGKLYKSQALGGLHQATVDIKTGFDAGPQYFWYGILIGLGFCIYKLKSFGFRALFCALLIGCGSFAGAAAFDPDPRAHVIGGLMAYVFIAGAYHLGKRGLKIEAAS